MAIDPTQRFSGCANAYQAGRPGFPSALVHYLETIGALSRGATIVDLGVGTGLSAEPFLRAGYSVIGVEPNAAMREAGDRYLADFPAYYSVNGRAEASTLPGGIAQLVVAGQAFHWFHPVTARQESLRLLGPGGWAALFWNDREHTETPFLAGYEQLCRAFGPDYETVRSRHADESSIATFFGGAAPRPYELAHQRSMTWEELAALAASASYLPAPGSAEHFSLQTALRELFLRCARGSTVEMRYRCRLYVARMN